MAQASATVQQEINGLYAALYGRAADGPGIDYWAAQLSAKDPAVTSTNSATLPISTADSTFLGQLFVTTQSTYFTTQYASLNDLGFVQALYQNVGGNTGDTNGVQYWLSLLTAAEASGQTAQNARAGILGQFAHDMLSIDLTVGAAALGLSASDYSAAVARQQQFQNKVLVSQAYADESRLPGGSILVASSTTSSAFTAAQDAIAQITSNAATVATAEAAIVASIAAGNLNPIVVLPPPTGMTYTLTTAVDNIVGAPGSDTFNGTYSDGGVGGGNTFQIGDTLAGGNGANNTLNITPTIAIAGGNAATSLVDTLWADITGLQNVNVTTGAGVINIATGTSFNNAFAAGGVHLTTTSTGGAINIDMATVPFTGAATITTTSTGGAQTIATGSGAATVTASSGAGAITVSGSDLLSVSATTTGAGAQTITSTAAGNVTVTATAASGTQTIVVGNGNDTINVSGSGNTALAHITVGSGSDTITLNAGHTVVDTLTFSAANGGSTTSVTTVTNALAADTITWAHAALNATNNAEGAAASVAVGVAAAMLADGYNTFTNGGNTYIYEYTGSAATSELVALVGLHTITTTTGVATIG
jgi:hypothetical protein